MPGIARQLAPRRALAGIAALIACMAMALPQLAQPAHVFAASNCTTARTDLTPDVEERALVQRINDYRAQAGLGTLAVSPALMATAAWKSNDLGSNAYFAHDDTFRSWSQRFVDCGYAGTPTIAENLAAGYADAASTFEQWRTSAGHNANMLNATMRAIGVARARVPGSPFGWYWTATFGGIVDTNAGVTVTAPQPSLPQAMPAAVAPAAASVSLSVGATAIVSGAGANDCLRVHSSPSSSAGAIACLMDGSAMIVSDGPVNADGYTWWRLGDLGWAAGQYLTSPGR